MTEEDLNDPKKKEGKMCTVCKEAAAKYCCPRCAIRTCSLPCVRQHKTDSGCTGQRDKTAYVAMKSFTDSNLLSDYRFLEDGGRKTQSCRRDFLKVKHDKPKALMKLLRHAESQGIELQTMPYPMSKRKNNSTYLLYRSKEILWHIEWVFPQADIKYFNKKQNQNLTLESILNKYLSREEADPLVRHKLRQYADVGIDGCRLLMKSEGRSAKDVRYHELDASRSILENLQGKCLVEYPSILVVLCDQSDGYVVLSKEEEDKMYQERRKERFAKQRNRPYQQRTFGKGDNSHIQSSSNSYREDLNTDRLDKNMESCETTLSPCDMSVKE